MPYQGSAQSVGFRNRTVADPSKRMRQEASQIEDRGRERVRSMEEQASQEIREMNRLSDIEASNSNYELKALSKFSDTITRFLEEDIVDLEKRRIEGEIEEGKRIYAEQGPAFQQQKEDVQNAADRSYDLDIKATQAASKIPNEEGADRVRKLSRWKEHGYQLAAMKEAGQNFGVYLDNELVSNETLIEDPSGGPAFKIKDYKGKAQYEAAVNYLQNNYIKDYNPAGLSAKVVNTVLVPGVDNATTIHRKQYYRQQKIESATLDLEVANVTLAESLNGTSGFPSPDIAINGFLVQAQDAYTRQGVANPRQAAKDQLITSLKARAVANPQNVDELIAMVEGVTIKGHPAGEKNLFDLYPSQISANALTAAAINQEYEDHNLRKRDSLVDAEQAVEAYKNAVNDGLSGAEQVLALQELQEKYGVLHPKLVADAVSHVNLRMGEEESRAYANALVQAQGGEITRDQLLNLDSNVVAEFEEYMVDSLFSDGQKENIKEQFKKIDGEIRNAVKAADTNTALRYDAIAARSAAERSLIAEAQLMYDAAQKAGKPISKSEAIRLAGDRVAQYIKEGYKNEDSQYYYTSNEGFKKFFAHNNPTISKAYAQTQNIIDRYKSKSNQTSRAAVNIDLQIPAERLELTSNGKPDSLFFALARLDGESDAFEILNAQRAKQGLAAVTLPPEADLVQNTLRQYPELKPLFLNHQSYNRINRGMEQVSGSVPNLMKAIGYQESSGNYKADNPDAYGTDNPALGKYQILWSNVKAWARQYGMPHPGTKEDFKNNPQYQETLARKAFEGYFKTAASKTDNRDDMIRMVAAAWYGGAGAMDQYDNPNYGGGPGYPNMQEYTMSVLRKYKGGMP